MGHVDHPSADAGACRRMREALSIALASNELGAGQLGAANRANSRPACRHRSTAREGAAVGRSISELGPPREAALTTEIIRDQAGLDALAEEWAALYAEIPTVTPFQSHAWVCAWARAYCRPGRLRVVIVRASGKLVAVAPLCLSRRALVPVLTALGGSISDFSDLMVPAEGTEVGEALVRALLAEPGWRVLELPEVRPDAAAWTWIEAWPGRISELEGSVSLELPAQPLSTVLANVPSRTANLIRRKLRKVDATGIRVTTVPPDRVANAVTSMLELHHEQWRNRGIQPEHLTRRFAAHLIEALPRMVAENQALVIQFHLDGELVASQLDLVGHQFLGYYLAGVLPRLKERIDVASLQVRTDLELAVAAGVPRYSMFRGTEDYKMRFRPEPVSSSRVLLSRPGPLGSAGYPTAARARAAVFRWAKKNAPWLQSVHGLFTRLRTLRAT